MSHPNPHDDGRHYPEDGVSHYPKKKSDGAKYKSVRHMLTSKAKALESMINSKPNKAFFKKHGLPKFLTDGKGVEVREGISSTKQREHNEKRTKGISDNWMRKLKNE